MPASGSDSFDRLHPEIRRWIWEQKWDELREVQDKAISAVLDSGDDVLISASTAAGKTEAAFLPILTQVARREGKGLSVIYVSPLKALINDQFRRLDLLCERLEINVVRWHGDAPQSAKQRTIKNPQGIALITPESIEALFIRRAKDAERLFSSLDFVVIDELHAFLQGPRGLHISSLLRRIDLMAEHRARRIGLSATIGDTAVAAKWMNWDAPDRVAIVTATSDAPELKLQIKGYVEPPDKDQVDETEDDGGNRVALDDIADHTFATLRGSNNLLFGGSRRTVEAMADRLRRRSEMANVPNEFFPHHGSIAKELREEIEGRLKEGALPTTAIATTTLELGIDLGSVKSVAQVGAPRSLASLRQRLGRSGRRKGMPAILRVYVRVPYLAPDSDPLDHLRLPIVCSVAAIRLLVAKFVETPEPDSAIATVVLHQILSLIVQRGGARADRIYAAICGAGPLSTFGKADFVTLLRHMASSEACLIEQAPDGTIMLGPDGERLTGSRDFYAIFPSDEEWRIVHEGRALGTIPLANAVGVGSMIAFGGRRWRVAAIDDRGKVLQVEPHRSAKIPKFDQLGVEPIDDRLAGEMRVVFESEDLPLFLDRAAQVMLAEGRTAYRKFGLNRNRLLAQGSNVHVLTWLGSRINDLLAVNLAAAGLDATAHDGGVTVNDVDEGEVARLLRTIAEKPAVDASTLSEFVENLSVAKYDAFVPPAVLRSLWATRHAEAAACIPMVAQKVLDSEH